MRPYSEICRLTVAELAADELLAAGEAEEVFGEFGAFEAADMASRVAWTAAVRRAAEERGFGWAYWEFGAGFGVYDRDAGAWRQELLDALLAD